MKRPAAFTLIELLIVVAIISILSSIAVVNFQEAQTRAKTARAQADMRTLATAIEAYAVDHSRYPSMTPLGPIELFIHRDPRIITELHLTRSPGVVPTLITTPIAYITRRPEQAFHVTPYDDPYDPFPTYIYYRPYYPFEWEQAAASGILMPLLPRNDLPWCQFGAWVLWCSGPDLIDWYANWSDFLDPLNPGSVLGCPVHAPWSWSFQVPYDPTNGTVSFGNVFRGHRAETVACCCPEEVGICCGTCTPTPTPVSGLWDSALEIDAPHVPAESVSPEPLPAATWNWGAAGQGEGKGGGEGVAAAPTPVRITTYEEYAAQMPDPSQIAFPEFKPERRQSSLEKLAAFLATLGVGLIILYVVLKWRQRRLIQEDDLGLGNVAVTDGLLPHIPGLAKRQALDLSGSTITDAGAVQLAACPLLEELNLSRTLVGDEGVKKLAALPALHSLNLAHTKITDAGAAHLAGKSTLRVLVLSDTGLTPAAFDTLQTLRGLRYLNVGNTSIAPADAARLRAQLPYCEVIAGAVQAQSIEFNAAPGTPIPHVPEVGVAKSNSNGG